jgi:4-diphosphocytidyl-2-C-methyl-D-erythritol kinase
VNRLNLVSYAKLNLYLSVLGRRPDNYHSIFTLFEKVSLADQVKLRLLPQGRIRISCSGFSVSLGSRNLAYQAASLLQRECKVSQGVEICIKKNIPVSAGLGGGSSNAAAVLRGLNQLWKLRLSSRQLAALAGKIGADVPFFLSNCSFACARARGDRIQALRVPVKFWHIIVVPRIKLASSLIYKQWDRAASPPAGLTQPFQQGSLRLGKERAGLTTAKSAVKILISALLEKDMLLLGELLFNSLEAVATAAHPVIKKARRALSVSGLQAVLMSGSGPAVFGLLASRKQAYTIARRLKAKAGNWDVFVAKTV